MKKLFPILTAVLTVALLASTSSAATSSLGDSGPAWSVPNDAARGLHIVEFLDTFPGEAPSWLIRDSFQNREATDPTCAAISDPKCNNAYRYQAVLPQCKDATTDNCIEDFGTIDSADKETSAKFERYFPNKALNQFSGDKAWNIPDGFAGSFYSLPSAPYEGGNTYYLAAVMTGGGVGNNRSQWGFSLKLYPAQPKTISYSTESQDAGIALGNGGDGGGINYRYEAPGFTGDTFCVADSVTESKCMQRYGFPADTRFYVKIRMAKLPGGWMHGRISNPGIDIAENSGYNVVTFKADPVAVPAVYKAYQWNQMPTELRANYDAASGWYIPDMVHLNAYDIEHGPGGRSAGNPDPLQRNVVIVNEAWRQSGMDQLKLWLPYVNDQATATLSYWSVRTLSKDEMSGSNQCFNDPNKLTGIVTTNSTQYSAGPPAFEKASGVLNYKVASPHFTTKHEVFKGTYDLLMRSDVARCVYGFSSAPVKADISVTSSDGAAQVVSTTLNEANGWLHLSANGFEFSAPQVNVKLIQDAPAAMPTQPKPKEVPVPANPAKKITITCVKGKITKKVIAIKPTCPSGYKKK